MFEIVFKVSLLIGVNYYVEFMVGIRKKGYKSIFGRFDIIHQFFLGNFTPADRLAALENLYLLLPLCNLLVRYRISKKI